MGEVPESKKRNNVRRWLLIALVAGSGGVLVALAAAHLAPPPPLDSSAPAVSAGLEADIASFAGDNACRKCHAPEFASRFAAVHRNSLRPATRAALGAFCPAPGRINGTQYSLKEQDGKLFYEVNVPSMPDKYQLWPLDYAFGAGDNGITFVSMLEGRNVVEMRMSYFPREHLWRETPGQTMGNPAAAGDIGNLDQSRHCLGCHTIAMSKKSFVPHTEMMGVGCEACHGPGRTHVDAMSSGQTGGQMARLGKMGGLELNTLCGKCHQTAKDVAASPLLSKMTYRFQPYGLMKSRCFLESGNRLSCLNCHRGHDDSATGPKVYERACLSCHGGTSPASDSASGHGKRCPVNPASGCISCHMPKRDALSAMNRTSGILLTEHRIAVYPPPRQ